MNKRTFISVCIILILLLPLLLIPSKTPAPEQFLRIHVRANSDGAADQSVKLAVKDEIITYLKDVISEAPSKEEAKKAVGALLNEITLLVNGVLYESGFSYTSRVKLTSEIFPERDYGEVTLPEGGYDSLIVELGAGAGSNWWCVIYPPMCFVYGENNGTDNITYRSVIVDFFKNLFKGR